MKKGLRLPTRPRAAILVISTADLMKKGLRHVLVLPEHPEADFNRRPDEEGIKTGLVVEDHAAAGISTADLMKKGLRLVFCVVDVEVVWISTADLMKKGLRHTGDVTVVLDCHFNRRPDEEGIKTHGLSPS